MKHKAFTEIVAHSCKVPQKTVALFARNLKEAGLLTSGARGVNAPEMTVLDLTRMVIALCATDRPAEAVGLTNRYCLAECSEDATIFIGEKEIKVAEAGFPLEAVLSGVLMTPTLILRRLQPEFSINWNTRTALFRVYEVNIIFQVPELETDRVEKRGIVTTRGISSIDLIEMALPFYLEKEDGTTWEDMTATGSAAKVAARHIFGVKDERDADE